MQTPHGAETHALDGPALSFSQQANHSIQHLPESNRREGVETPCTSDLHLQLSTIMLHAI